MTSTTSEKKEKPTKVFFFERNPNPLNVAQGWVQTEEVSKNSNALTKQNSCTPSPDSFNASSSYLAERNPLKRRLADCNDPLLCSQSIQPAPAKQITPTHLNAFFNRDQPTFERLIIFFLISIRLAKDLSKRLILHTSDQR